NTGEWVYFDDVRDTVGVESHVNPRPIAATEHAIRAQDDVFDLGSEPRVDARGALEDVERFAREIPDPLRFIPVDRHSAVGERVEIHTDQRKHTRHRTVAEHATRELGAGEVGFDDDRLLVGLEKEAALSEELVAVADEVPLGDAFRRSL